MILNSVSDISGEDYVFINGIAQHAQVSQLIKREVKLLRTELAQTEAYLAESKRFETNLLDFIV